MRLKFVAVVLIILFAQTGCSSISKWFHLGGDNNAPQSIVTVDQIKQIAQLSTTEYHISTFIQVEQKGKWYHLTNGALWVYLKGIITGSVDLSKADIQIPEDPNDKRVTVSFKQGAILISNPAVGPNDIKMMTQKNPLLHPIKDSDRNDALNQAIEDLKKTASEEKIEAKTAEQAKRVIGTFLSSLGYQPTVTFEGLQI